ncbi:isopentenyl-diphosphate Delta-isomerase [Rhodococcoides kyotonense]|uniref:isopentenyl-diphosphate Delta-isomerase n=1 Tax=Rhodococcoides kyotonense TaxID=398843 RepID=UPI001C3DC24C|nr:isopentenyl-diphosphate Delta-isomerase [Rhodococcus kyotonensis]
MTATETRVTEEVVLVDSEGRAVGTHPKATVHTTRTPLHLAFSCYVFNGDGEVLVTERARDKNTWPGVTTNSCCGHPGPGEDLGEAVIRRLAQELGIDVDGIFLLLPDFRYRAVMDNGVVENELCPVFGVLYDGPAPRPNPDEVHRAQWIPWTEFSRFVADGGAVSPWCADQIPLLQALGADPGLWPVGDASKLPEAAPFVSH